MSGFATLTTVNNTPHPCWITIYDIAKTTHLDYGDLGANSSRDWRSGNYAYGSVYHIRYEVKGPDGNNLYDTNIQVEPFYDVAHPYNPITETKVQLEAELDGSFYIHILDVRP